MQNKFAVQQVFTPTTPARLTFIERDKINNRSVSALRTPGKQIIIFGHSGSGKTTLLVNKLDQVYERHVTTRCIFGMTYEQVIGDAFGSVGAFYENKLRTQKGEKVSVSLASEYSALKASIQSESSDIYVSESKCILTSVVSQYSDPEYLEVAVQSQPCTAQKHQ
jgi:superfamily I DNA and RNA helicase